MREAQNNSKLSAANVSANSKGQLNEKSIEDDGKESKPELKENKWTAIKDIIFDSEEKVLEYLKYHCMRYRDAKHGRFSPFRNRRHEKKQSPKARHLNFIVILTIILRVGNLSAFRFSCFYK